jgi:CheY-like chemotaxis protein
MNPRRANRKGNHPSLAQGRSPSRLLRSGCILLIEDNEDEAVALKRSLRKAGVTMPVKIAQDGTAALSYLQGDPPFADRKRYPLPTIIILDLYLPNNDGFEILKWLRSQPQFSQTFIAVLTVPGKIHDIARAYRVGANSFLTTPCRPEDIRNLAEGFPAHWAISAQGGKPRSTAELTSMAEKPSDISPTPRPGKKN